MVQNLAAIGGKSVRDLVKRIMNHILTDAVCINFSWKGRGGKRAFSVLKLSNVVIKSVKANPGTAETALGDIENRVKEWLRFAKEICGGRKERLARKMMEKSINGLNCIL